MGMVPFCRGAHPMKEMLTVLAVSVFIALISVAGLYLYSLTNHCKPLPGNPLDGVIHYECEAP